MWIPYRICNISNFVFYLYNSLSFETARLSIHILNFAIKNTSVSSTLRQFNLNICWNYFHSFFAHYWSSFLIRLSPYFDHILLFLFQPTFNWASTIFEICLCSLKLNRKNRNINNRWGWIEKQLKFERYTNSYNGSYFDRWELRKCLNITLNLTK